MILNFRLSTYSTIIFNSFSEPEWLHFANRAITYNLLVCARFTHR